MLLPLLFLSVMMGFRLIEIETNASRRFVKILGPEFVPPALVKIQGVVNPFARRIHITFEKDNENFIFHMSIRFDEKKNVVVINSQTNGTWGEEERVLSYFPFAPSQGFEMEIQYEEKYFNVTVNDQLLLEFDIRDPTPVEINKLIVEGDVLVSEMRVETLPGETNKECEELSLTV